MRITFVNFRQIPQLIEHYSRFNPSPLTIKKFMDFGQAKCEKTSFLFLKRELPVRLANIMKEIQLLPDKLLNQPSVSLVQSWYLKSFEELLEFESINTPTATDLQAFCDRLLSIRQRHNNVVQTMAEGVIQLKSTYSVDSSVEHSIQYFLNRFYMMRISIRMLIHQHAILFGGDRPVHPRHIGCVDPNCDLYSILLDAFENARFLCEQYYLMSPELIVEQHNGVNNGAPISIVYVPSHLYHMLFELFKNSLRAVVETHGDEDRLPPIKVLLTKGEEDVSIKITDKGGGIRRSLSDVLFNYMYSTAPAPSPTSVHNTVPLAGYGFGLPLSKLYAKYFHGDLVLNSFEGHSTDAIIYLKVLSSQAEEYLPVYNAASSKNYRHQPSTHDWSSSGNSSSNNSKQNKKPFNNVKSHIIN